ncbi:MAG: hypothetical protein JST53_15825 [Actinobacteria bacterium]|nr:hypothetical protein [Actinomycetota bacterium]
MESTTKAGAGDRSTRPRHHLRWIAAVLLVVFIAGGIPLTQQGGDGGGPLNAMAKAAEVTQSEPGGHIVVHGLIVKPGEPNPLPLTGRMVYDSEDRTRGYMTVPDPKTGGKVKFLMAAAGTHIYISSELLGSLPGGRKWMGLDFRSTPGSSSTVGANDSAEQGFKMLEEAGDVRKVGEERVLGVETTHYRGTLNHSDGESSGGHPQIEGWIDGQERVRRVRIVGSPSRSNLDMTMDFFDFGKVPPITMPDPSEVFDATSLVEDEAGSATG